MNKERFTAGIKEKDLHILLSHFYNYYFVEYLEDILADEKDEYSTIILLQGIDYFFKFCKDNHVDIPFADLEEFLKLNYVDREDIYKLIMAKYHKELADCKEQAIPSFENTNNKIEF